MKAAYILIGITVLSITACSKSTCKAKNRDCFTTNDWTPVCGCDGVTYNNSSEAGCVGVDIAYNGPCQ